MTKKGEARAYLEHLVDHPVDTNDCVVWPYSLTYDGYARIWEVYRFITVNRIVCKSKHGPAPTEYHQAAHECGNRACVNERHIEWKTPVANRADMYRHGTMPYGERNGNHKITDAEKHEIKQLAGTMSQQRIGDMFGVNQQRVSQIINQREW